MTITIYHNNNCSKSRSTLAILEEKQLSFTVVDYLNNPPSPKTLCHLAKIMGKSALDIMRTKEALFQELGLDNGSHSDAELFQIMSDNPKLIERPIVIVDDSKAIIARPPELVYEIL